jgi:hypothetical protein
MAALLQDADEMAADEATGTGDDHEIILGHSRAFHANREGFYPIFQRLARQGLTGLWIRQARWGARLRASRFFVKSPNDAAIVRRLWWPTADSFGGNRWSMRKNSLIPVT